MNQIVHAQTAFNPFNRNRAIIFSILAAALAVLSFHGALDNLAFSKLSELKGESVKLLLVSGGINAAVSVLQTIEFKIPFISSAQVGQVLDPINDASERFTVGLLWAIGSLYLQEILLTIASGWVFKWGFLALTALTAATLLLSQSDRLRLAFLATFGMTHVSLARFQGILIKTLVVATIFRFIVPAFVAASFLVSQALVAPEIEQHAEVLKQHEEGLSNLGKQISEARDEVIEEVEPDSASPADQAAATENVPILRGQVVQLEEELTSLQAEEGRLTAQIDEEEGPGLIDWISNFTGDPDEALEEANARVEQNAVEVEQKEWELACIEGHTNGENCDSFLAEPRKQALSELKSQLESEQTELREELQLYLTERDKHMAKINKNADGDEDSGWRSTITGTIPNFLTGDSAEEIEAAKAKIEELDREIGESRTLEAEKAAELECVDQRIAGEHCDSPKVDDHLQVAFGSLKERLKPSLQSLREELASRRDEREGLVKLLKLEEFKAERKEIESKIENTKELITQKKSELVCAEQLATGEDCNTLLQDVREAGDWVGNAVSDGTRWAFSKMGRGVLDGFKSIVNSAQDMIERMANMLILVVIENIVLPIIFLAIALKGSVPIARGVMRISTSIGEDTREALSALDRALPGRTN